MCVRTAICTLLVGALLLVVPASDVMASPQNTGIQGPTVVRAGSIAGFYLLIQDVPGLAVTWSSPTGTVLPAPYTTFRDFGKEQFHRGALRWTTPGVKTVTATVSWNSGTYNVTYTITVI